MVLLLAGACSTDDDPEPVPTPSGFEAPDGVELTPPGSELAVEEPATVVLDLGGAASSAITVEVTEVVTGTMRDFRFFSLDEAARASTPYYVRATVTNEGPAGLGGVSLPLLAHSDADTVYPASELVGTFEPCPTPTVPESFLAGSSADVCLVFLVPEGETLRTVDLQPGEPSDAVRWVAPEDDRDDQDDRSEDG
ncbi:hypothetical protein GCM10009821_18730 [Aeromicrobium halocynthiae]|uniref:DUF4352 domain-containing protein n=2 Tax=Aeromicrobium halocynthiae TaxID=560557 RepID=A0ABN2W108_9ACTN